MNTDQKENWRPPCVSPLQPPGLIGVMPSGFILGHRPDQTDPLLLIRKIRLIRGSFPFRVFGAFRG